MGDKVEAVLKVCGNVRPENIFKESVANEFDIPITAKFLSMNEYVDVIIIIVNRESRLQHDHTDAVSIATMQGIMDIEIFNDIPIIFRIFTTFENSSYEIGKTAVEMALKRLEAFGEASEEFEHVDRETSMVGSLIIVILVLLLVGFIIKKRGINVNKSIFTKTVWHKMQYDRMEVATPVNAEIA